MEALIAVLPGDGIGPEVRRAERWRARRVGEAAVPGTVDIPSISPSLFF